MSVLIACHERSTHCLLEPHLPSAQVKRARFDDEVGVRVTSSDKSRDYSLGRSSSSRLAGLAALGDELAKMKEDLASLRTQLHEERTHALQQLTDELEFELTTW